MALTLYYSPGSSSMATHIALHEVGAPFELKLTSLHEHKNREPGYLAVNPEGKVPTLVLEGGETKSHPFVRADLHASREQAIEFSLLKAQQIIDEQGDRIFG